LFWKETEAIYGRVFLLIPQYLQLNLVISLFEMLNFKYRMSGNFHSRIVFPTSHRDTNIIPTWARNLWLNTDLLKHVFMEQFGIALPFLDLCFRCNVLSFNELLEYYPLLQDSELVRVTVYSFWGCNEYIRTLEAKMCVVCFVKFSYLPLSLSVHRMIDVCRWNGVVTSLKIWIILSYCKEDHASNRC